MEIKNDVLDLATLFFESHTRPTESNPVLSKAFKEIKDFVVKICLDGSVGMEHFDDLEKGRDPIEALNEYGWYEIFEEHPVFWFVLYLFNKGIINEEQMKEALNGTQWKTSCHGDYIQNLTEKFGVKINGG